MQAFKDLPPGLTVEGIAELPLGRRPAESISETYLARWMGREKRQGLFTRAVQEFAACGSLIWTKKSKKQSMELDLRTIIAAVRAVASGAEDEIPAWEFVFDWSALYVSPLALVLAALGLASAERDETVFSTHEILLTKICQS
jgi:hypothetical protein